MDKIKHQVFISSTYADLSIERKQVLDILLMADCIPAGMEAFVATDDEQFNVIKRVIDLCDYYILIIGKRYGSVNESTGLSYTEMEYNYAINKGIPVLVFAIDDSVKLDSDRIEVDDIKRGKLAQFKNRAMKNRLASIWRDSSDLMGKVAIAIMKAKSEIHMPGWVRATKDGANLLGEINDHLKTENKYLKKELELSNNITIKRSNTLIGELNSLLSRAHKDVIISGGSMAQIIACDEMIKHISREKKIKVRLLALNVEKPEVLSAYRRMKANDTSIAPNLDHLKAFVSDNIDIHIHDFLPTAYYFAADMNEQNGYIRVDHFLPYVSEFNYPHVELTRSSDAWYEIYRQQIESLWKNSVSWKSC